MPKPLDIKRKDGSVYEVWDIAFSEKGVRVHRQLDRKTHTKAQAVTLEKKLRREIFDQVELGKRPDVPLAACIQRYIDEEVLGGITGQPHKAASKTEALSLRLAPWVIGKTLSEVVDVSRTLTADMLAQGLNPATINRYLSVLRRTAHLAIKKWDLIDIALWEKIATLPGEEPKRIRLSVKEVWAFIDALKHQEAQDMALVTVLTGFRLGEIERILAPDRIVDGRMVRGITLDRERSVLIMAGQKNDEYSWHPILPLAIGAIDRSFPLTLSRPGMQKMFKAAFKSIGRPEASHHTLRKSAGSVMLDLGVSLSEVSQVLRHKTMEVTAKSYGFMDVSTKRAALEKLEAAFIRHRPLTGVK